MLKDLYDVLGVSRKSVLEEIKVAYKRLARQYHPDLNQGSAEAHVRFTEVNAAYSVLSDDRRRLLYDRFGHASLEAGFDATKAERLREWEEQTRPRAENDHAQGFADFFGSVLSGEYGGTTPTEDDDLPRRRRERPRYYGSREPAPASATWVDRAGSTARPPPQAHRHTTRRTPVADELPPGFNPHDDRPPSHRDPGIPYNEFLEDDRRVRPGGGTARTRYQPHHGPASRVRTVEVDPVADAQEECVVTTVDPLLAFIGGVASIPMRVDGVDEVLKVRLRPGVENGERIRLRERGPRRPGGTRADLVVELNVPPHPLYRREGKDLHLRVPITILEAVEGAQISIPTPIGRTWIPVPTGTTRRVLRLEGRGVQGPGLAGALVVELELVLPSETTADVLAAARRIEAAYAKDVRADLDIEG